MLDLRIFEVADLTVFQDKVQEVVTSKILGDGDAVGIYGDRLFLSRQNTSNRLPTELQHRDYVWNCILLRQDEQQAVCHQLRIRGAHNDNPRSSQAAVNALGLKDGVAALATVSVHL